MDKQDVRRKRVMIGIRVPAELYEKACRVSDSTKTEAIMFALNQWESYETELLSNQSTIEELKTSLEKQGEGIRVRDDLIADLRGRLEKTSGRPADNGKIVELQRDKEELAAQNRSLKIKVNERDYSLEEIRRTGKWGVGFGLLATITLTLLVISLVVAGILRYNQILFQLNITMTITLITSLVLLIGSSVSYSRHNRVSKYH